MLVHVHERGNRYGLGRQGQQGDGVRRIIDVVNSSLCFPSPELTDAKLLLVGIGGMLSKVCR